MFNSRFKNILKALPFISIYIFISIRNTSPHDDNLRHERIGNYGTQFSCMDC